MGLFDWAFVIGPFCGLPVSVLVLIVVCLTHRVVRQRLLVGGTAVLAAVLVLGYWGTWWFAFDAVPEAPGETVPNGLFPVTTALVWLSAAATVVLVILTAALVLSRAVGLRRENRSPDVERSA